MREAEVGKLIRRLGYLFLLSLLVVAASGADLITLKNGELNVMLARGVNADTAQVVRVGVTFAR